MPVNYRTNNRILPANSRQVDVAERAVSEITDVMQRRTQNAFRVQGYPAILYTKLKQGQRCSCQSSNKKMFTLLDEKGNASAETINKLLTGGEFAIRSLSSNYQPSIEELMQDPDNAFERMTSPGNEANPYKEVEAHSQDGSEVIGYSSLTDEDAEGANGDYPQIDIEEERSDFDLDSFGMSDVACAVCYGTGFVGGYSPFKAFRAVYQASDVRLPPEAELVVKESPWQCISAGFSVDMVLPKGALALQAMKVWQNTKCLSFKLKVDGQYVYPPAVLAFCDGKPHKLEFEFDEQSWTHVEIQFNVGGKTFFEVPVTHRNNAAEQDPTAAFNIMMGPDVPHIDIEDVIVESVTGKTLIVESTPVWQTRARQVLGWDCNVRVCQPRELFTLLPKLGRVAAKPRTVNMVIDNRRGHRT